jgi:hypothetical protein
MTNSRQVFGQVPRGTFPGVRRRPVRREFRIFGSEHGAGALVVMVV